MAALDESWRVHALRPSRKVAGRAIPAQSLDIAKEPRIGPQRGEPLEEQRPVALGAERFGR